MPQGRLQEVLRGDPLPWLLEDENPSARYLTLRHLLEGEWESQISEARASIMAWSPVSEIVALMNPQTFWGRRDRPFYAGAVGTHAMLKLLADLGAACTPQIQSACENLLEYGQHDCGGFTYDGTLGRTLLCYTGIAVRTLLHFGFDGDPRVSRAFDYLVKRSDEPDGAKCPYADGPGCQWGTVKALTAFAEVPLTDRPPAHQCAVNRLTESLLEHDFDWDGRDARWLQFGFPLDYQSDLVELCDVLARLGFGVDPRMRQLLRIVTARQNGDGRWEKGYGTRALRLESRGQPSKWITISALRALRNTQLSLLEDDRAEIFAIEVIAEWDNSTSES